MTEAENSQREPDPSAARARLWRNIFAAAAAAMIAQLVFNLGRPGALFVSGIVILVLLAGLVVTQLQLQRILRRSVGS